MIYVDAAIHLRRGTRYCHLFSEDLRGLHDFADRLRLLAGGGVVFDRRAATSWPHYDISRRVRQFAVGLGALEADRYTTCEVAWRLQGTLTPERAERLAKLRSRVSGTRALGKAPVVQGVLALP